MAAWSAASSVAELNNLFNNVPPPPPPVTQFFVAVNGQQTGPFGEQQLQQMIQSGQVTKESLLWKNGMAAWTAAAQVSEVAHLFAQAPPPLPPQ